MDPTDEEQEARRQRLREWLQTHGGHARVVAERRLTPSQASYVSQVVNGYSFAGRAARNMETRLGMPSRWLDHERTPAAPPSPAAPDVAEQLVDAIAGLSPARWASVRAQLEMLAGHPEMRDDVLAELRVLLAAAPGKRPSAT